MTFEPFTAKEPVALTEPVNWWVFDNKLPKRVDPVTKSILEVMVWTTIVWAVRVPLTVKLSAEDAVDANEELTAFRTYDAVCAFWTNDAVWANTTNDAVLAKDADTAFKT